MIALGCLILLAAVAVYLNWKYGGPLPLAGRGDRPTTPRPSCPRRRDVG